jgi:uncharacterized protein YneF (UPF0154 family)
MKNDKTNLIIWATVALVIGVVIGTFLIAPATTGDAKAALKEKPQLVTSLIDAGYANILVSETGCALTGGTAMGFNCCRYCRYIGESGKEINVNIYNENPTVITNKEDITGGAEDIRITPVDCRDMGGYVNGGACYKKVGKESLFIDVIK